MLLSVVAFMLWLPAIIGLGSVAFLAARRVMAVSATPVNWLYVVFLGFAILATAANLLNFWLPISPSVSLGALAMGWLLLVANRRGIRALWPVSSEMRLKSGQPVVVLIGAMLLLGFAALVAQQPMVAYDAGLYHLQSVKWLTENALPLGLANLHGRFGFNSSWFSVAAILELPFMVGKSSFILNGMIFLAYGATLIPILRRGLRHELPLSGLYLMTTTTLWLGALLLPEISAPSPEVPILFLTLLLVYVLLRGFENSAERPFAVFITSVLSVFAVTIKLSSVPLLLVPAVLLVLWLHNSPASIGWRGALQVLSRALTACLVISILWILRSVMLSGCLVYPVEITCLPSPEWAVPQSQVRQEALWIRSWARSPGNLEPEKVMASWDWFMPWLRGLVYNNLIVYHNRNALFRGAAALSIIGAMLWLVSIRRRKAQALDGQGALLVAGVIGIVCLLFWFVTAPDTRFVYGLISTMAALLLCSGLRRFQQAFDVRTAQLVNGIAVSCLVCTILVGVTFAGSTIVRSTPALAAWPPMPAPQVAGRSPEAKHTALGVLVYAHTPGIEDRCWDAPLPCTPTFNPDLRIDIDPSGHYRAFYPAP